MTRNSLPTPTDQDHYIRNLSADLIDNHGAIVRFSTTTYRLCMHQLMRDRPNMFYDLIRVGDNHYHGLFEIIFDTTAAVQLLQTNRAMNDALMQYISGRNIEHFMVIDLRQPQPTLLPGEPQPRLRGPFLPPRHLPKGGEHADIFCFSHTVSTLMIPHEVRTWCAMELLHEHNFAASDYDPSTRWGT